MTINGAKIQGTFSTSSTLMKKINNKTPMMGSSTSTYHFNCSCRTKYVSRTQRSLPLCAHEHIPPCLGKSAIKSFKIPKLYH